LAPDAGQERRPAEVHRALRGPGLRLGVLEQAFLAVAAAHARGAHAAHRPGDRAPAGHVALADVDRARAQAGGDGLALGVRTGEDRRVESVLGVVGLLDRLVHRVDRVDGDDGPEGLLTEA